MLYRTKFILPILLIFIGLVSFCSTQLQAQTAKNGVIDLRKVVFNEQAIPLDGYWGFFPNAMVAPNDTLTPIKYYTQVPGLWNNLPKNTPSPGIRGFATYRLTVLLPHNRPPLSMELPDAYTAYQLYVNGELMYQNGKAGTSKASSIPLWRQVVKTLDVHTDTLQLLLQVSNFYHSRGGPHKSFWIGASTPMNQQFNKTVAADFMLAGALLMGGLFFFGLFLFGNHDKAILYFSLFCMAYSYRIVGSDFYALHNIFPHYPWAVATRIEYIALYGALALLINYMRHLYPDEINHKWIDGSIIMCLLLIVSVLILPPYYFTRAIIPFLLLMVVYVIYTVFVFIKAALHKRIGAKFAMISIFVLLSVFVIILLEYLGVIGSWKWITSAGYAAFFFLQSLILSFRFAISLKLAKEAAELGMKAKSQFLSTMSHEIRTPLNAVIGISHMLLEDNPKEEQIENLNILLFSGQNLLHIVNDILDYNKMDANMVVFEKIPIRIADIGASIVHGFSHPAKSKGVDLQFISDPKLQNEVIGDPTRLTQVLTNLVDNAIKFTQEGKVVLSITVKAQADDTLTLLFSVEDTGIGIPLDKQQLIFEEFTQADVSTSRSFGGTGLGLSICKKLLGLQGITLQLKSQPGIGTIFSFVQTFSIGQPISKSVTLLQSDATKILQNNPLPLKNIHVLIAEDHPFNVHVAQKMLTKWGATVDVAANGQLALDMVRPDYHHIVLMDMHMPVLDGYQATKRMRQSGIILPIIAVTASLEAETQNQINELGMDAIVTKPFKPDELLTVMLHFLQLPNNTFATK